MSKSWYDALTAPEKIERLSREMEELANKGRDISGAISACNDLRYGMRSWLCDGNEHNTEDDEMIPDAIGELACVLTNVVFGRVEIVNRMLCAAMREMLNGSSGAHGADQGGDEAVVGKEARR